VKTLCIETSTNVCSTALTENDKILFSEIEYKANSHSALLTVLIEKITKKSGIELSQIDAVAVSSGPGSYTGLRIGVSTAKGICYALDKPLIAVSSLRILAERAIMMYKEIIKQENLTLCPMIDARRMEVYTTFFNQNSEQIDEIKALIINSDTFLSFLEKQKIAFFGNGVEKCKEVIKHKNAFFLDDVEPLASAMILPVNQLFNENNFEDTAYFEPFYLKDFIATIPKKNDKILYN